MKLTKDNVRKLLPGQVLTVVCDDAAEIETVYQTAIQARREPGIDAHGAIEITRSNRTMTVVIRRMAMKKGGVA